MHKIVLSALLALSFSTSLSHAQSAWTGGDDLPTNPLACDATPAKIEAKAYDGGSPTNAPDRKGKPITVVDVPKLVGIGYFAATALTQADRRETFRDAVFFGITPLEAARISSGSAAFSAAAAASLLPEAIASSTLRT